MIDVPLATFLSGVGVGLAVAVPIGPMGVLCIQQTLTFGLVAGLATGLAAATVQVTYGFLAVLGLAPATTAFAGAGVNVLSVGSAMLLLWFAVRIMRRELTFAGAGPAGAADIARSYRNALTFGFANPLTVLLFFAAFPALTSAGDVGDAPLLVGGVFSGVIGWYIVLSSVVALLRQRLSAGALNLFNKASGLALATLGLTMLLNGLRLSFR
jgi:threonine/homoserine/homoserine lactone efflux protein